MRLSFWSAGFFAVCCVAVLAAQEQPASNEEPIHTLHVYTNLVQVPTLVLQGNRQPLTTQISEKRFSVSIDSGPWFQVTHVRLEGNDPISMSILLDTNAKDFMPGISNDIAGMAPASLTARDHVSIYAMDCGLIRGLNDVPADREMLRRGADAVLKQWTARKGKKDSACKRPVSLWDSLGFLASELAKLPGRRVIVVVSDGRDRGSARTWNEVRSYMQAEGVAVFGVSYIPIVLSGWSAFMPAGKDAYAVAVFGVSYIPIVLSGWSAFMPAGKDAYAFQAICELSGGMVSTIYPSLTAKTLQRLVTMMRGRYIVEFPRPSNSTAGAHDMRVKITKGEDAFVRPSGISIPMPDPELEKDPSTIHTDTAVAPEQGNRRILTNPK
jgi:hypothetical protein